MTIPLMRIESKIIFDLDGVASRTHLMGLREIIRLRGGFQGLPLPLVRYIKV